MAHAKKAIPPSVRTCRDFLDKWMPRLRSIDENIEIDFSFKDDAITITDMRIPSALRTGVLYNRAEVEALVDARPADFKRRVEEFMAKAIK